MSRPKRSCKDLAIFGGKIASDNILHVNKPNAGSRKSFDDFVDQIWKTRWFTNEGTLSVKLENDIRDKLNVEHCVIMSSGTEAMQVLIKALDLDGEVIMPSFTFISTAHILNFSGIQPVFCDVDPTTCNADVAHCESLITERTTAIIPTHIWGRPCNIEAFEKLAKRYNLRLIFDAAHAFGCTSNGLAIGRYGDAEVFSFNATKSFHCGEGGAVTCTSQKLAEKMRALRNFGFDALDHTVSVGLNAKLPETSAALGLANLEEFDSFVAQSCRTYESYVEKLSDIPQIKFFHYSDHEYHNYHYVSILLDGNCILTRDEIVQILHAENILARRYFFPGCHELEPFKTLSVRSGNQLSVTEKISQNVLILPAGSQIFPAEVTLVCDLLRFIFENAVEIKSQLNT
jgi:dTDP-4-amino-4,6-dideoxygalactose transaminase